MDWKTLSVCFLLLASLLLFGCLKPSYKCSTDNDCILLMQSKQKGCQDAIITKETSSYTLQEEITRKTDVCNLVYSVQKSGKLQINGTVMTCNIPLDNLKDSGSLVETGSLRYCEGNFKDLVVTLIPG